MSMSFHVGSIFVLWPSSWSPILLLSQLPSVFRHFPTARSPISSTFLLIALLAVYRGVLRSGSNVRNSVKDKVERVGRMLQMHANERTEVKEARAGDIVALVGMKDTVTGDTLCDDIAPPVVLERMDFPKPVIKIAVEPKTKADQEKMGFALNRLAKVSRTLLLLMLTADTLLSFRRIRHSAFHGIPTADRRRSKAWGSCTWRSSWIA